jgi:uncharacterized protein with HEPN domain
MNTFEKLRKNGIIITQEDIKAIAERYKIKELSVFGSRRAVDIVEPAGIQNPYRRNAILSSVERLIEIIGEAANHVSNTVISENPDIPWLKIIGLRNKIVHDYGEILTDRIWLIASKSIPELIDLLESKHFL